MRPDLTEHRNTLCFHMFQRLIIHIVTKDFETILIFMNQNKPHTTPDSVVVAFYGLLHDKKFDRAFDCLTDKIKSERKWYNLERFSSGYEFTIAIDNITCTIVEEGPDKAICHIAYRDAKMLLSHPLIDGLDTYTPDIDERIESFKEFMIENLGGDPEKIRKIEKSDALKPNAVEDMTWIADCARDQVNFYLSADKPYKEMTARYVTCVKQGNGWLINRIVGAPLLP